MQAYDIFGIFETGHREHMTTCSYLDTTLAHCRKWLENLDFSLFEIYQGDTLVCREYPQKSIYTSYLTA